MNQTVTPKISYSLPRKSAGQDIFFCYTKGVIVRIDPILYCILSPDFYDAKSAVKVCTGEEGYNNISIIIPPLRVEIENIPQRILKSPMGHYTCVFSVSITYENRARA